MLGGARALSPHRGDPPDPEKYARTVVDRGLRVVEVVPPLVESLLDAGLRTVRGSLATLLVGGDVLTEKTWSAHALR